MSNYRSKSKGNYNQGFNWDELYMITESWRTVLEFYSLEIDFLESLMETYFVKLLYYEDINVLQELQKDLSEAKKQSKNISDRIQKYSSQIIDEEVHQYASVFKNSHQKFEDEISEFKVVLEMLIYTVFKITKDVLENEKPKFIWKYN